MPAKSDHLLGAFIAGRLIAENAGLNSSQATQWGVVLVATGLSPASILLVSELVRLEAQQIAAQANHQAQLQLQLRDTLQQTWQQARETHEQAVLVTVKMDQVISRLDQLSERVAALEQWTQQPACQHKLCEEILHALRQHQEEHPVCRINTVKPGRRNPRCRRRWRQFLRAGRRFLQKLRRWCSRGGLT